MIEHIDWSGSSFCEKKLNYITDLQQLNTRRDFHFAIDTAVMLF